MTRNEKQMRAYRAELAMDRVLRDLGLELARGTDRRHLQTLLELGDLYVDDLGPTVLAAAYKETLRELEVEVGATRDNFLRLVQ